MLSMKVTGVKEAKETLREEGRRFARAWPAAAFAEASQLMTETLPDVPRRTGELRESRYVSRTDPVEAGFGADYAALVHEMAVSHPIGRWKFLQSKLNERSAGMVERMAERLAAYAAGGITLSTVPAIHPTRPKATRARPPRATTPRRR